MQANNLIQTKLQPPILSPDVLPRTHLIEQLENGRFRKLTLISAPAGYGKSVLAGMWLEACNCPFTWLSLDPHDNNLGTFLSYVVHAVQTILPDTYDNTIALLNGLQLPPLDVLTTSLVNETAVLDKPILLILDDYHLIHNKDIHQLVDALIQYQSAHLHLVLITRQDPPLDIINLRARNELAEIRLAQLRFSEAEAQQYLTKHLGNALSPELTHQLFQRTEGWAVGLRLAVLALRNQSGQARLMEMAQGNNQYIMSYLVSEVLSQQPEHIQRFLLITSLLDRFCAPLCDILLESEDFDVAASSQEILEQLCRENIFLIPLDHKREWFRYHHLFQDLLRHELKTAVSDTKIKQLHAQASAWFAQQGFIEEALDHAFLANDTEQAIQILAQARYQLLNETQWQRLQQLLRHFPQEVIDHTPDLRMAEAWLCYHQDQNTKLPILLTQLTQLLDETDLPPEDKIHLRGEISALHSYLTFLMMDIDSTCAQAEQALAQIAPELWIARIFAWELLAVAQQMDGDLNRARATILRNFDEETVHNNLFKATTFVTACEIEWMAGDLKSIQQYATQAVALCQDGCSPQIQAYGHYHLGTVAYLQNNLTTAEEHFAFVHNRPYTTYGNSFAHSSCGLALTYQAQGREQEARDVVDAALSYFLTIGNTQLMILMKAFQAELALQQGQMSLALQWATPFDSPLPLSPMYRLYVPHFTLAKIWLVENTADSRQKAADLLTQIKAFLESTHNSIFLIETLALQAILYQAEGNKAQAMTTLEQALNLALPNRVIRPFVNPGYIIGNLLTNLPAQEPERASFKLDILAAIADLTSQPKSLLESKEPQPLPEPLTNRELEILTLLTQRQTNREIAEKLLISPHTVHSHIKKIYRKLDVNNRRQAATRAIELGLVTAD